VAVLGAGNGGHAFAGDLARRGYSVRLYNAFPHEIVDLQAVGAVRVEGIVEGVGPLDLVTTDMAAAVSDADIILVVVPATAHAAMAEACGPHLRDGQVIVLNPGRTGGALEFRQVLARVGARSRVVVAEAQTLLFACRISGPARVRVSGIKRQVPLAALPARDTPLAIDALRPLYPQFAAARDVLETGLDNIGAIFHPGTVALSAARIEAGAPFEFYRDMTPCVVRFLEALDEERLAVARAYEVWATGAAEWLARSYEGVRGATLYERILSNPAYAGIAAPRSLETRYVLEDVPTGLVPIASLGRLARLEMRATAGLVDVCGALLQRDFWAEGRTLERLGLAGLTVAEVRAMIREGPAVVRQVGGVP
jgi:opine dehydrogenase